MRRNTLFSALLSGLVMAASTPTALPQLRAQPATAEVSKTQSFRGMDGATHTLGELRGRVAVVNFWATWCGPCKEEMPRLQKLAEQYLPRGVIFVAISLDDAESQPRITGVLRKLGVRIPIWTGATDITLTDLNLGALVPATLILDENGLVVGKIEGEMRDKDIVSRVDWLLGGRKGKQPKIVQKNDD